MSEPEIKKRRLDTSSDNIDNALLEKDKESDEVVLINNVLKNDTKANDKAATDNTNSNAESSNPSDVAPTQDAPHPQPEVLDATSLAAAAVNEYQNVIPRQPPSTNFTNDDSNSTGSVIESSNENSSSIAVDSSTYKPSVGSDEWHKVRRDNHKEVERRRRETINNGINELAQIVPDCDKHKGLILRNAVDYIKKLKDNEQRNMEKLTLEKLLTEQAISELSATNKALKQELADAWREVEHWKSACGVNDGKSSINNGAVSNSSK